MRYSKLKCPQCLRSLWDLRWSPHYFPNQRTNRNFPSPNIIVFFLCLLKILYSFASQVPTHNTYPDPAHQHLRRTDPPSPMAWKSWQTGQEKPGSASTTAAATGVGGRQGQRVNGGDLLLQRPCVGAEAEGHGVRGCGRWRLENFGSVLATDGSHLRHDFWASELEFVHVRPDLLCTRHRCPWCPPSPCVDLLVSIISFRWWFSSSSRERHARTCMLQSEE